jgi:hypothetical protein
MIFSDCQRNTLQVLPLVFGFNYELARDDLFPFAISNMVNYEMIEFAATCGHVVAKLLPVILDEEHLPENFGLFAETISVTVEAIQSGASALHRSGFSISKNFGSLVPVGQGTLYFKCSLERQWIIMQ